MSHDHVVCEGTVKRLPGLILHYPVDDLRDAWAKADYYSTVGAKEIVASGRRISFMTGISHGIFAFIKTYFLKLGFLDGARGFLARRRQRRRNLLSLHEGVACEAAP